MVQSATRTHGVSHPSFEDNDNLMNGHTSKHADPDNNSFDNLDYL